MIGNGNVALDVARMLAKHADDLLPTEIPTTSTTGLAASPVTDVHVFGRRGPAKVKFTPLELRELGELRDVDMIVHDEDFDYDEASRSARSRRTSRSWSWTAILQGWRKREVGAARAAGCTCTCGRGRVEILGDRATSTGIRWERTEPDGDGRRARHRRVPRRRRCRRSTARSATSARRCPGVPFDERHGVIPNHEGQVLGRRRRAACRASTRPAGSSAGPVGLIGHTKSDAMETDRPRAQRQRQLVGAGATPTSRPSSSCSSARGVDYTTRRGLAPAWTRTSTALGAREGRARVKVVPRDEMLAASLGESAR